WTGGVCDLRAVRLQYAKRIARSACERSREIALVCGAAGGIGDSRDHEPIADDSMLVFQKRHPQPVELFHPLARAPVVLVIAGDDEDAVARAKVAQRFDSAAKILHMSVDQISGDDDGGRLELVRSPY